MRSLRLLEILFATKQYRMFLPYLSFNVIGSKDNMVTSYKQFKKDSIQYNYNIHSKVTNV
jgi:hypothetical protein